MPTHRWIARIENASELDQVEAFLSALKANPRSFQIGFLQQDNTFEAGSLLWIFELNRRHIEDAFRFECGLPGPVRFKLFEECASKYIKYHTKRMLLGFKSVRKDLEFSSAADAAQAARERQGWEKGPSYLVIPISPGIVPPRGNRPVEFSREFLWKIESMKAKYRLPPRGLSGAAAQEQTRKREKSAQKLKASAG